MSSSTSPDALPATQTQVLDAESGVENKPFVRMSKAEKKKMKYERAKVP